MAKKIVLVGAFDTKALVYDFIRKNIEAQGFDVMTINYGIKGSTDLFTVDIENTKVAESAGTNLECVLQNDDLREQILTMAKGVSRIVAKLHSDGSVAGIFAVGKSWGTNVATMAMRTLPIGVPKVMVTTVASSGIADFVGVKDVNIFPAIVDVSRVNSINKYIFANAAGAIAGMAGVSIPEDLSRKPAIAITMFGQTKPVVDYCHRDLEEKGFEPLIFHATGLGGRIMEGLVEDSMIAGIIDVTTTEIADAIFDGVFSAGNTRLTAAGKKGIPHVVVPGCMDMVNFGSKDTILEKYRERQLYYSKPTVTLMRTNPDENWKIGKMVADNLRDANPVKTVMVLPLKGISRFDSEGCKFWNPEANKALFESLKTHINPEIPVIEVDMHINDNTFGELLLEELYRIIGYTPE